MRHTKLFLGRVADVTSIARQVFNRWALMAVALAAVLAAVLAMQPVAAQDDTIDYPENGTDPVATFTAEDPEGATPITWSLAEAEVTGVVTAADVADFTHFDINKDGELTFDIGGDGDDATTDSVAPDFEAPRGEASPTPPLNNTYKVVVVASDAVTGGNMGYHKVTVKVTDVAEAGKIEVALSGSASAATAMQFRFGTILTATVTDGDVSGATKTIASPILRWYRGSTEIDGATEAAYTTTAEDVGSIASM